jgi:hypothetical protein
MERAISDYFEAPPPPPQAPGQRVTPSSSTTGGVHQTHPPRGLGAGSKKRRRQQYTDSSQHTHTHSHPDPSPPVLPPGRSSSVPSAPTPCGYSSPLTPDATHTWLLGRRVTLGYTLNAGFALRRTPLQLRFEGVLAHHQSVLEGRTSKHASSESASSQQALFGGPSSAGVGGSSKKKKLNFSAANLMFECGEEEGGERRVIRGRLSNLICK